MKNAPLFIVLILCLVSAALVIISNNLLTHLIDNISVIKLHGKSASEIDQVRYERSALDADVKRVERLLADAQKMTYPTIQDLRALGMSHRLSIVNLERYSGSSSNESKRPVYRAALTGTMGNIVRFLKACGEQYLFDAKSAVLTPATTSGDRVSLNLLIAVSE